MTQPNDLNFDLNPYAARVLGFVDRENQLKDFHPDEGAFRLLINAGSDQSVKVGQRVLVFSVGPEVTDPGTGVSLGFFEVVRGEGKVESVQVRMAVIRSTKTTKALKRKPGTLLMSSLTAPAGDLEWVETSVGFDGAVRGDFVRFI